MMNFQQDSFSHVEKCERKEEGNYWKDYENDNNKCVILDTKITWRM